MTKVLNEEQIAHLLSEATWDELARKSHQVKSELGRARVDLEVAQGRFDRAEGEVRRVEAQISRALDDRAAELARRKGN